MKRMKKIFAMLLALTMVLGMTMTSNAAYVEDAAEGLEIPVTGAGESAVYKHAQLIKADPTTESGWAFSSDDIGAEFIEAFDKDANDDKVPSAQEVIWQLIKKQAGDNDVEVPEGTEAASDSNIAKALRKIKNANPAIITLLDGKTVTEPGVYFIDVEEEGYAYNPMTAYVSFHMYNSPNAPTGLESTGTVAKRVDIHPDKTNDNGDAVTEIGRTVTYTVTTTVPYFAADNTGRFTITDKISGADYVLTDNKMMVSVKIGDADAVTKVATLSDVDSFELDLTTEAKENNAENAGKALVITYSAIVKDLVVKNDVVIKDGDHESSTFNYLFAGTATLTKIDSENNNELANATFVVRKVTTNGEGESVTTSYDYAVFTTITEGTTTKYKVTSWISEAEYNADKDLETRVYTTDIVSDAKGKVVVEGLDSSVAYEYVEVEAPTGYSLNETPEAISWVEDTETIYVVETAKGTEEKTELAEGEEALYSYTKTTATGTASMTNTKLIALPSTGGIGTTIFTVAGCGIMIAAAFFFFASRKKEN